MQFISIKPKLIGQSLAFVIVLLFSVVGIAHARGYGSGDGEGQNHNNYVPMAEARFFAVYDVNKDGYLDPDEVVVMGMPARIFKQADSNKNGKLSKDEFARMWASPPE